MNKFWQDKIKDLRRINIFFIIVTIFILVGIIIGINSVCYMKNNSLELQSYFKELLSFLSQKEIGYKEILISSTLSNLTLFMFIFILGNLRFGTAFIFILMLFKGYTVGYTFTLFIKLFGIKGLCISMAGVFLQNIIYIPCFMILSIIASYNSYEKLKNRLEKINKVDYINDYVNMSLSIAVVVIIGIIIESFLVPNILKYVVSKLSLT